MSLSIGVHIRNTADTIPNLENICNADMEELSKIRFGDYEIIKRGV